MPPLPSAVVFDMGKVLLDFDYAIVGAKLAERCGQPLPSIRAALDQSDLLNQFEYGRIQPEQFFQSVAAATGFPGSFQEFDSFFHGMFTPIEEMIAWQDSLRLAGFPTFILSNTNKIAVDHIQTAFPFYRRFSGHILSFQTDSMKPEPAIYLAAERLIGHSGPHILFIDDRDENVQAARARGWQAIHHLNPASTLHLASQSGLPLPPLRTPHA